MSKNEKPVKADRVETVYNNIVSFNAGMFCAERSWDSKLRPFFKKGLAEKFKTYGNDPSFEEILDALDQAFERGCPECTSFRTYADRLKTDVSLRVASS